MADFKDVMEEALQHDNLTSTLKPWERDAVYKWIRHLYKYDKWIELKKSKKYKVDKSWHK